MFFEKSKKIDIITLYCLGNCDVNQHLKTKVYKVQKRPCIILIWGLFLFKKSLFSMLRSAWTFALDHKKGKCETL